MATIMMGCTSRQKKDDRRGLACECLLGNIGMRLLQQGQGGYCGQARQQVGRLVTAKPILQHVSCVTLGATGPDAQVGLGFAGVFTIVSTSNGGTESPSRQSMELAPSNAATPAAMPALAAVLPVGLSLVLTASSSASRPLPALHAHRGALRCSAGRPPGCPLQQPLHPPAHLAGAMLDYYCLLSHLFSYDTALHLGMLSITAKY